MSCLVVSATLLRAQLLAGLLAQCCPVAIADACDSVPMALAAIDRWQPGLLVLDRDGGDDACERIATHLRCVCPGARLILLSSDPRLEPLRRDLAPVLHSPRTWQALIGVVRASDEAPGEQSGRGGDPLPDGSRFKALRPRERSVLELLGSGLGSRDIAVALGVSKQTVETYRKNISAKLGVSGSRLVRIAVLYGCVYLGGIASPLQERSPCADEHVVVGHAHLSASV
jgi:DNA-binding CsgD family transcriptional regulator